MIHSKPKNQLQFADAFDMKTFCLATEHDGANARYLFSSDFVGPSDDSPDHHYLGELNITQPGLYALTYVVADLINITSLTATGAAQYGFSSHAFEIVEAAVGRTVSDPAANLLEACHQFATNLYQSQLAPSAQTRTELDHTVATFLARLVARERARHGAAASLSAEFVSEYTTCTYVMYLICRDVVRRVLASVVPDAGEDVLLWIGRGAREAEFAALPQVEGHALILGTTGTGKTELAALARIHGDRKSDVWVAAYRKGYHLEVPVIEHVYHHALGTIPPLTPLVRHGGRA